MASASQIAAALADAQAKQALADAAALAYTNKVTELSSLGGGPRERCSAIRDSIVAAMDTAAAMFPPSVTTDPTKVAADIEQLRAQMVISKTAFARYPELSALRVAYPAQYPYYSNAQAVSACSSSANDLNTYTTQTTVAGAAANLLNPAIPADAAELLRLELLVMANYHGVGYSGTGYCGYFLSVAGAQTANQLATFVHDTSNLTTTQILDPYYQDKVTKTNTATTAWTYYNSLTLDAPVLNQQTWYASGGVTVSASPVITTVGGVSAPTSGSVTFAASGGVSVGGIASAIPFLMWQQGEQVQSYVGDGGVSVGGTASLPGTTGTGGAVVITIHGTLTGGGGEAAVVLADLTLISSELADDTVAEAAGTIAADLTLIESTLIDELVLTDGTIEADLTLLEASMFSDDYVVSDGTIEAELTLLEASMFSDDYVAPASDGTIEAELTALISELLADDYIPPDPIDGTIDDAPLTVIGASLEGETLPHINGELPLIVTTIGAGIQIEGTIETGLTLIEPIFEVLSGITDRIYTFIPRVKVKMSGNFNLFAKLTKVRSDVSALRGTHGVVTASLPRIVPKVNGNFNLKTTLPRMGSQVNAIAGKKATVTAKLTAIRSSIAVRVDAVISTTLPKSRAALTAHRSLLSTIAGSLPLIDTSITPGDTLFGRMTLLTANVEALDTVITEVTAELPAVTTDIHCVNNAAVDAKLLAITTSITALCSAPAAVSARLFPPTVRITASDLVVSRINAALPVVRTSINVTKISDVTQINASLGKIIAELASGSGEGTVELTLPSISASMAGLTGVGGVIDGRLPRMGSTSAASTVNIGVCVSAIPKTVRARLLAAQGARAGIDAKLKVIKANLR